MKQVEREAQREQVAPGTLRDREREREREGGRGRLCGAITPLIEVALKYQRISLARVALSLCGCPFLYWMEMEKACLLSAFYIWGLRVCSTRAVMGMRDGGVERRGEGGQSQGAM